MTTKVTSSSLSLALIAKRLAKSASELLSHLLLYMQQEVRSNISRCCGFPRKRLAVIGSGPIGVELALAAVLRGIEVTVFESGEETGAQVLQWQHVTMFSPWCMNVSDEGWSVLLRDGSRVPDRSEFPTGGEYVANYLRPVSEYVRTHACCASWNFNARVLSVGRGGLLTGESIGGGDLNMPVGKPHVTRPRASTPFRLLVSHCSSGSGDRYHEGFDFVCDCSGCYRSAVKRWPCVLCSRCRC